MWQTLDGLCIPVAVQALRCRAVRVVKPPVKTRDKSAPTPGGTPGEPTDPNLSNVPAPDASGSPETAGHDGGGVGGPGDGAGLLERAKEAASLTLSEHVDQSKAGGARKAGASVASISMETVGNGTGAPPDEAEPSDRFADALEDSGPDCEQELIAAGAEMAVDSMNDSAAMAMEFWALHHLGDVDKAADAAKRVRMNPRRQERMIKAVTRIAKRNPERALKIFGLLMWWDPGIWLADVGRQFLSVKNMGLKLRGLPAPVPPAASPQTTMPAAIPIPKSTNEPDFK